MKLFFSGFGKKRVDLDPRLAHGGMRYRLLSCHEDYLNVAYEISNDIQMTGQPHELMYDSGAFTAWNRGKHVELDDLLRAYDNMLERFGPSAQAIWFISLDVIPGAPGRPALPNEIAEACRVSDENYAILRKRYGERVLPVFHQEEPASRLREVARMASYICVSPRNDLHEPIRRQWAQDVHKLIPKHATHGLATTGYNMMNDVPWASVDSARYVNVAMFGAVFFNRRLNDMLFVSEHSGAIKDRDVHFRTLSRQHQRQFLDDIDRRGFTLHGLETSLYERLVYNRLMMAEAQHAVPEAAMIARSVPYQTSLFPL